MCGIAAQFQLSQYPKPSSPIVQMAELLHHRGPDDGGFMAWNPDSRPTLTRDPRQLPPSTAFLAHRRLSIIDLSEGGWQPQCTPDQRYFITYNGEIYNYVELRKELEERHGIQFRSQSDTEVLLQAYACWGKEVLQRLVGMFAFIIFDTQTQTVFAARDFFGIKPLYFLQQDHQIAFASETKALVRTFLPSPQINPRKLGQFLRFGQLDDGEETLFEGVQQLPAGHYLEFSLQTPPAQFKPVQYWRPTLTTLSPQDLSFDEASLRLQEIFLRNIDWHMRSDVKVGAALSGGIDSSAIVCGMRHLKGQSVDLHTFSFISENAHESEEKWVDLVAQHTRPTQHKVRPTATELVRDLNHMIETQDQPFGSSRIYAQYRVFQLAKEAGIKVMLDGQGADEVFAGYISYIGARLTSLIRQRRYLKAIQFSRRAAETWSTPVSNMMLWAGGSLLPAPIQNAVRPLIRRKLFPDWLDTAWLKQRGGDIYYPARSRSRDALRETLSESLTQSSIPNLLRFEDRNSMAHSIESRVPFLTPELVNFAYSLPEEYIVDKNGLSKTILRKSLEEIVPRPILNRRDKVGFQTPEKEWLSTLKPWIEETFRSQTFKEMPFLRSEILLREWNEIEAGRQPFTHSTWRVLSLIKWAEIYGVRAPH